MYELQCIINKQMKKCMKIYCYINILLNTNCKNSGVKMQFIIPLTLFISSSFLV